MKKSILIGALAALMLFAFVACDNSTPGFSFKDVSYVTIEQNKDYIDGETPTAAGFSIVVNYTEGEPVVLNGAGNVTSTDNWVTVKANDDFSFTNSQGKEVPVVATAVEYKTVTGATISGITSATIDDTVTLDDLKNIVTAITNKKLVIEGTPVITLSYEGGTREFTLDDLADGEFGVVLSLWKDGKMADASTDFKADETYTVTLDKYRFGTNGWEEVKPVAQTGLSVNVVKATISQEKLTGIRLTYDVTSAALDEDIEDATTLPSTLYINDEVTVTVNKVYEKDGVERLAPITKNDDFVVQWSTGDDIAAKVDPVSGVFTFTVQNGKKYSADVFVNDPTLSQTQKAEIRIPAGKNAVVPEDTTDGTITIKQNTDVALAAGSISGDITKYVKFADGEGLENLDGTEKVAYTVTVDPVMSFSVPAKDAGSVKVYCYLTYNSYEPVKVYTTVDLSFSEGQSND